MVIYHSFLYVYQRVTVFTHKKDQPHFMGITSGPAGSGPAVRGAWEPRERPGNPVMPVQRPGPFWWKSNMGMGQYLLLPYLGE